MIKKEQFKFSMEGHLKITEYDSKEDSKKDINGKIVLDKKNAIHPEHASIIIARGLADRADGSIYSMWFGTGGATVGPSGNIIYATPNTTGSADLNDPVYFQVVDDNDGASAGNFMTVRHINGTLYSDTEIRCVLDNNQPFGQTAIDGITSDNFNTSQFSFSEIGLKSYDGLLITHVVFAPILKTSNKILTIIYLLRITIVVES